jgi:hypothetical protein
MYCSLTLVFKLKYRVAGELLFLLSLITITQTPHTSTSNGKGYIGGSVQSETGSLPGITVVSEGSSFRVPIN